MVKLQKNFDPVRYLGQWYLIAEIPQPFSANCDRQSANYSLLSETEIQVFNQCYNKDWIQLNYIFGKGLITNPKQPAAITVYFPPQPEPSQANYLVHKTDYDYYSLVGSPDFSGLYILCRDSKMKKDIYKWLLEKACKLGYDTKKIKKSYDSIL